ncbi:MAG: RsmD family RNA methyltransferase [Phycisphaerales bacterium]|jgi:16S rRNA (guanine(966)-N(2))-methyltransferase RsmD
MRIIAGTKRGMKLLGPKTDVSRPITDRVKESLFSVLYKYDLPNNAVAADLFCGVGSLALEALSRGAEFVTFVEQDPKVISVLNKNIEKAGFVKASKVIRGNAFKLGAPNAPEEQNVQSNSALSGLMDLLGGQVAGDGVVVVRTEHKVTLLEQYGEFRVVERRRWGTMAVTILQKINV